MFDIICIRCVCIRTICTIYRYTSILSIYIFVHLDMYVVRLSEGHQGFGIQDSAPGPERLNTCPSSWEVL